MTAVGDEDQFLLSRLNDRCQFREATFAGTHSNGRGAPTAVVRGAPIQPPESTGLLSFGSGPLGALNRGSRQTRFRHTLDRGPSAGMTASLPLAFGRGHFSADSERQARLWPNRDHAI